MNRRHYKLSLFKAAILLLAIEATLWAGYYGLLSDGSAPFRLSMTALLSIIAFFCFLAAVKMLKTPNQAEVLTQRLSSSTWRWSILGAAIGLLVAGILFLLLNPAAMGDIEPYYASLRVMPPWSALEVYHSRLFPLVLFVSLVSAQTILVFLLSYWYHYQEDLAIDLSRSMPKSLRIATVAASLALISIACFKAAPFLYLSNQTKAFKLSQEVSFQIIYQTLWVLTTGISLMAGWLIWLKYRRSCPIRYQWPLLFALAVAYLLLTGFTISKTWHGGMAAWNIFYINPDSSSYTVRYSPRINRPPLYPLFIQLVASGSDYDFSTGGLPLRQPIEDTKSPFMRVVKAQKVLILTASLLVCFSLMGFIPPPLTALFFLWLYDRNFFSEQMSFILSEGLAQVWLFLILAVFFAYFKQPRRLFLPLAGVLCALLFLTRAAGVYGGIFLAGMLLDALRRDWRSYWLAIALAIIIPAAMVAVPPLNTYLTTGVLQPSPLYSIQKMAFALEVAKPEDVALMPDDESRQFFTRIMVLKAIEDQKIAAAFPGELERTIQSWTKSVFYTVPKVTAEMTQEGTITNADILLVKIARPLLRQHRWEYYRIGWRSLVFASTQLTRLNWPFGFWPLILICLVLAATIRGWIGYSALCLIMAHLLHLFIVAFENVPIRRYIWETEFLVLLAIFLLVWGTALKALRKNPF